MSFLNESQIPWLTQIHDVDLDLDGDSTFHRARCLPLHAVVSMFHPDKPDQWFFNR